MSKIFIFKHIALVAITLILVSVIAGCVGTKAPQGELEFAAKAVSGLIITHKGGEPLTLKDEKITVKREVDGKVIDGLNAVPLFGNNPEFQDGPAVETLTAGQKIRHVWKDSLIIGDVLVSCI